MLMRLLEAYVDFLTRIGLIQLRPAGHRAQGGWVNLAAGAVVGAAAGALKKKPMAYKPYEMTTDQPYRADYARDTLGNLQSWQNGAPLMTQAQINEQLSGSRGRLAADMGAERMRIGERALGRQGAMGGMAEASMAALGRAGLGQSRQLESGVHNALAQQAPQFRLSAAQAGLGYIGQEQDRAIQEYHMQQQAAAARQQFSKWGNILGGAVAGAGAMSGMGGMMGGGGGQAQTWGNSSGIEYPPSYPAYAYNTQSGIDYPRRG